MSRGNLCVFALVLLGLTGAFAADCTSDDYIAHYTECTLDGTHDLVYYLKKTSVGCNPVSPPANVYDLPCNIRCASGTWLPMGATTCQQCPAGTYSDDNADVWSTWTSFPPHMGSWDTWCAPFSSPSTHVNTCQSWKLSGNWVETGNITKNSKSILQLTTNLLIDGYVSFSYRADTTYNYNEVFDLYVDGVDVYDHEVEDLVKVFNTITVNLTAGVHTLQWHFGRDSSSVGDMATSSAQIRSLEIFGLEYATFECSPCPAGTYSGAGAASCTLCPYNTFSATSNSSSCQTCAAGQYAYLGQQSCKPKVACNVNDTATYTPDCTAGQTSSTQYTYLVSPQVCDSTGFTVTAPQTVACPACPAGTARVNGAGPCVACQNGYSSPGGSTPCTICGPGQAAYAQANFNNFNNLTNFANAYTNCTGDCGTSGWRFRGDSMDSGIGHGAEATVFFEFTVEATATSQLFYELTFNCVDQCSVHVGPVGSSPITWTYKSFPIAGHWYSTQAYPYNLQAGTNTIQFFFQQILDPSAANYGEYTDRVSIRNITVTNTPTGGASTCKSCPIGSSATDIGSINNQIQCIPCGAGLTSSTDQTHCQPCDDGFYSRGNGDTCHACGDGTTSNADHSDCTNTCAFNLNGVDYDMSEMNGISVLSYSATDGSIFYVSPCNRGNMDSYCPNVNHNPPTPIDAYACQYVSDYTQWNAGWTVEYLPFDNATKGFQAVYYNGDINYACPKGRNVTVNFLCNPHISYGTLVAAPNATAFQNPTCNWNFNYEIEYACPLCTENDYSYYYTDCVNGTRTQTYFWYQPQICNLETYHGYVQLPSNQKVNCSDDTETCPAGKYVLAPPHPTGPFGGHNLIVNCIPCPAGEFSTGGALAITSWTTMPPEFKTTCSSNPCTIWSLPTASWPAIIGAGVGTSSLIADLTMRMNGTVKFDYKMFSPKLGSFQFFMDDALMLDLPAGTNEQDFASFNTSVTAGNHEFRWVFSNGVHGSPSTLSYETIFISNVVFDGYDYHTDRCTPCPLGYYTNSSTGFATCQPCPENTIAPVKGSTQCTPCTGTNGWSYPGGYQCQYSQACNLARDYDTVYGPCVNGQRTSTKVLRNPVICVQTTAPVPTTVPCGACPASTYRPGGTGDCVGCAPGKFWDGAVCADIIQGWTATRSAGYFNDNYTTTWPAGFTTGCSGACITPGWRVLNGKVDSGVQSTSGFDNPVDSWLQFETDLVVDGLLTFNYTVGMKGAVPSQTQGSMDGLLFYVDGQITAIRTVETVADAAGDIDVAIPLTQGHHVLKWVYHQTNGNALAYIHDMYVTGAANSILASSPTQCPGGYFSTSNTDTSCTPCPAGTAALGPAATECFPCGNNQYALYPGSATCTACESGSTSPYQSVICTPQCEFTRGDLQYSLSGPFNETKSPIGAHQQFYINVCGFTTEQCPNSHSCLQTDGQFSSAGASFRLTDPTPTVTDSVFAVYFEHGTNENCYQNATTIIDFFCDTAQTQDNVPVFYEQKDACTNHFTWSHISACPVCTDKDYREITGVCSGGHREVSRTRINTCNGAAVVSVPSKKCSSHEFPTGAIVAVVVVFVVLVAAALVVVIRNRMLSNMYSRLLHDTKSQTGASKNSAAVL